MTRDEQWVLEEKYDVSSMKDLVGLSLTTFEADRARLAAGEPVAYVIGSQPFLGLKIFLDSKPLIPRSETEWWVGQMLAAIKPEPSERKKGIGLGLAARSVPFFRSGGEGLENMRPPKSVASLRVLDLCAGSGAIGCAMLATLPEAHVYFGEIDPAHEATIRKNIEMSGFDAKLTHIGIGDLFAPFSDVKFDLIACNPPYVPSGRELPVSVAQYEPALALRAGDDGLALIRRIAIELPNHLTERGVAWIECDSTHAEAASALFEGAGLQADIRTDQYGFPRVIVVSFS